LRDGTQLAYDFIQLAVTKQLLSDSIAQFVDVPLMHLPLVISLFAGLVLLQLLIAQVRRIRESQVEQRAEQRHSISNDDAKCGYCETAGAD
jgi:hypothetical protein